MICSPENFTGSVADPTGQHKTQEEVHENKECFVTLLKVDL